MLATLALMAALSQTPAQTGALKLTNERATLGLLGPTRKSEELVPGDRYHIAFDIEGIRAAADGQYHYSMGMEVTDSKGKSQYKLELEEREPVYDFSGGSRLPAFANVDVGLEQPPGEYTLTVLVEDRAGKAKQT